jgi:hypothetical protein
MDLLRLCMNPLSPLRHEGGSTTEQTREKNQIYKLLFSPSSSCGYFFKCSGGFGVLRIEEFNGEIDVEFPNKRHFIFIFIPNSHLLLSCLVWLRLENGSKTIMEKLY